MALLGHANVIKYGVMRTPWTSHPNELAILQDLEYGRSQVGPGSLVISDDITGFDQAVRRSHQEAIAKHIYARYWPPHTVDLWLGAQAMSVLGPPLHADHRAFLYSRPHGGVTTSGIITTSLDGTLINLARALTAIAMARKQSVDAAFSDLLNWRWTIRCWGDDTVLILPNDFPVERYVEASTAIGYQTSAVDGATFLMKHYDLSRRAVYPLATRVFQQTIWNEQPGRSEEVELLGLFARTTGFTANPFWREVWNTITTDAPLLDKYDITSRDQLARVIMDPGFQLRLHTAIRAHRSIVAGWLARSERGHTEDSALLGWLQAIVGEGVITAGSLDLSHAQYVELSRADKLSLQLGSYLSTPVEERTTAPPWIAAMLNPEEETEEQPDYDEKGDKS
jgi:hypothetical protein